MFDNLLLILSTFFVGIALGCFYFGSLWITVRQLPTTAYPAHLFIVSWLCRIAITLFAFYLVMDGQRSRALTCLGGFIIARIILIKLWKPKHPLNLKVYLDH